jgi:hypothetical protein
MQCLPGSKLPDDLRGLGHHVQGDGEGERVLPAAIVERFARGASGELEPIAGEHQVDRGDQDARRHRQCEAIRLRVGGGPRLDRPPAYWVFALCPRTGHSTQRIFRREYS